MYNKIKDSLLRPKNLRLYVTNKGWRIFLYFLFLSVLFTLPDIISLSTIKQIDHQTVNYLQIAFKDKDIPYLLEDNILIAEKQEITIIDIPNLSLAVVFDTTSYENILPRYQTKQPLIIHLSSQEVIFFTNFISPVKYRLLGYDEISTPNLDFKLAKDINNVDFWNSFIKVINQGVVKNRAVILSVGLPTLIVSLSFYLFILILMTSTIITLFNRYLGAKFIPVLKITILAYTSYTIGALLAILFHISFFNTIGSILSVIYAMIGTNALFRANMINPNPNL